MGKMDAEVQISIALQHPSEGFKLTTSCILCPSLWEAVLACF